MFGALVSSRLFTLIFCSNHPHLILPCTLQILLRWHCLPIPHLLPSHIFYFHDHLSHLMCFTCVLSYLSSPPDIQPPHFLLPVPGHLVLFHSRIPDLASLLRLVSTVCVCLFVRFLFSPLVGSQARWFPSAATAVLHSAKMWKRKFNLFRKVQPRITGTLTFSLNLRVERSLEQNREPLYVLVCYQNNGSLHVLHQPTPDVRIHLHTSFQSRVFCSVNTNTRAA